MATYTPLSTVQELSESEETNDVTNSNEDTSSNENKTSVSSNNTESRRSIELIPFVLINVLVILITCSGRLHHPVVDQYLYKVFAEEILGNRSGDTTKKPCFNNTGINNTADVKKVQALTSEMLFQLEQSKFALSIFATIVLGALTPILSRKITLLVPLTGYLIRCVVIAVVVTWHWNIHWLFFGYVADGLFGSANCVYFAVYLYTSDITPRDRKRTLAMTILEALKGAISACLHVVTGQLIQKTGFVIPSMLSAGAVILCVIVAFLLPNRKPQILCESTQEHSSWLRRFWLKLLTPFSGATDKRVRWIVVLACFAFFLTDMAESGISKIRILYEMNEPFCWDAITIGWFDFGRDLSFNLISILVIWVFARWLPGVLMGIPAALMIAGGWCLFAFAKTSTELFATPVLTMALNLPPCLVRGETSWLLEPSAQGPWFAVVSLLESLSMAAGAFGLAFYKSTLSVWPGAVFILAAAFMVLVAVIFGVYHILWTRHMSGRAYKSLSSSKVINED